MASEPRPITRVTVDDINDAIDTYVNELPLGYRLDMIRPADEPTEAWLSNSTSVVRLRKQLKPIRTRKSGIIEAPAPVIKSEWHAGRSRMQYRDLIPDRLDGRIVASQIRIAEGGPVPDYVHYHTIRFQAIYCLKGRIKVVYEDQGPPFWLAPGDCVLQPPEIRHRVLEAEAGSEVLEVTAPAEHETWIDHDLELPNKNLDTERAFGGQRFQRHIASTAEWEPFYEGRVSYCDTGIADATNGYAAVNVLRIPESATEPVALSSARHGFEFLFIVSGAVELKDGETLVGSATAGDGCVVPPQAGIFREFAPNSEAICVQIPDLLLEERRSSSSMPQ